MHLISVDEDLFVACASHNWYGKNSGILGVRVATLKMSFKVNYIKIKYVHENHFTLTINSTSVEQDAFWFMKFPVRILSFVYFLFTIRKENLGIKNYMYQRNMSNKMN